MKKLLKIEKWIIATTTEKEVIYNCSEHGVFGKRIDVADGLCIHKDCKGVVTKVENIEQLREQCRKDLKLD